MSEAKRRGNLGRAKLGRRQRGTGAPAGKTASIPDEMSSAQAKDQISDIVKKAAAGGRTTILSRGYAIAIIGPIADIPTVAESDAPRHPTTEIKSGQTSIKGIIARTDFAVLTIHGEARAAVYRPDVRRNPAQTEDKLDRLIDLLEESRLVERQNQRALDESIRLGRLVEALHAEVAALLDVIEQTDPARAAAHRERYAEMKKTREALRG
jgi:antitoxin (DNA-binding transcriptional repressor) of toxin-antitoxin stability system